MRWLVSIGGVVLLGVVVLCAAFVWPTPWRYDRVDDAPIRIHRVTGQTQRLTGYGWVSAKAPGATNIRSCSEIDPHSPFADIARRYCKDDSQPQQ